MAARKTYRPKLFDPNSRDPFALSRSKIDLFVECPRCFYLDRRLGVSQPPGYPFSLNSAVDKLLKKEFDIHRAAGTSHPLLKEYKLDYIPFQHARMDQWRDALGGGIEYLHIPTNLIKFVSSSIKLEKLSLDLFHLNGTTSDSTSIPARCNRENSLSIPSFSILASYRHIRQSKNLLMFRKLDDPQSPKNNKISILLYILTNTLSWRRSILFLIPKQFSALAML